MDNDKNINSAQPRLNGDVITAVSFSPSATISPPSTRFRFWHYALALVLLLGALALWFLFSAKSVVISTLPITTQVKVSGGLFFQWHDHYIMLPGEYRLEAETQGHFPLNESFVVTALQNQQAKFSFTRLPGQLTLRLTPDLLVQSLSVTVDGQPMTLTDSTLSNIAAGEHQLSISAPRYFDYQTTIVIEGMEREQYLEVNLTPAWADISLHTEPSGAQVIRDGELLGETPLTVELLNGEHQLSFQKAGYQSLAQTLDVVAGQDQQLAPLVLFQLKGRMVVTTEPSGVSVSYGQEYLGTTPLDVAVLPDTTESLLLFKDGYQSHQIELLVPSGQRVERFFRLKQQLGKIAIKASPADALLYVNNVLLGRANQVVELPVQQQNIRIEKSGYVDYQQTILPNPALEQLVAITMKTHEQAKWESLQPIITSYVGGKLKLFKPKDTFEMGASRREQGRRANEVQRTVFLSKPFYLGFTEVTNREFRQFLREHSSGHVKGNSLNGLDQPVVKVSWQQAALFCNWLSERDKLTPFYQITDGKVTDYHATANGYRLPTEAEWVWAARFEQGQMLKYPWGSDLPPAANAGNFADISGAPILGRVLATYNDKYIVSAPVASYPQNNKGLFDLSGNVAEWIHDYYQIQTGLSLKTEQDPMGPLSGDYHVIRGSSWAHGTRTELRLSYRDYGREQRDDLGFRIARNAM